MSRYNPHSYQEKAIAFMISRGAAGLFLDPGLGKTSISLMALKILKEKAMIKATLVIATLRPAYITWPNEVRKWDQFAGMSVGILHGPDKDKLLQRKFDVYVINPEGLKWLTEKIKTMKELPFDVLIVDESSKFRNSQTQRFKLLKAMLGKFRRRYILTGSPAPRSLLDLFGQMYILDLGATLGRYFTHYRMKYFYQTDYLGYEWSLLPGADKQIYDALGGKVLRMSAEDHLDLPELVINDIWVDLPPAVRKVYNEMEKVLCAEIEAGTITAANAGVAVGKCRQIASGGIFTSENTWENLHSAKTDVVIDLIEELSGKPALIGYEFRHDLERLREGLGPDTPYIGGGVTNAESLRIVDLWNKGELTAVLGQPQSMAHGLNLQQSNGTVIWYTIPWDFENYDQLIRRVYRQGNTDKTVVVHRILARNTIDEDVAKALERKEAGQSALFDALKARLAL